MAETDLPLIINVKFDTAEASGQLDALENRAQKGINVRTGEGTFASPARNVSAQVANAQEAVIAATRMAGMGSVQAASLRAAGIGVGSDIPEAALGARSTFSNPVLSQGQQQRDRAMWWAAELQRREAASAEAMGVIPGNNARGFFGPKAPPSIAHAEKSWQDAQFAAFKEQEKAARDAENYARKYQDKIRADQADLDASRAGQSPEAGPAQPGTLSRIANYRVGRGITFGAAAIDRAFRAIAEYQTFQTNMALAGGDMAKQVEGTIAYREQLMQSVPLAGNVMGFMQDPSGQIVRGIRFSQQDVDNATKQMGFRERGMLSQRAMEQDLASASGGGLFRVRAEAGARMVNDQYAAKQRYDEEIVQANIENGQRKARDEESRQDRARQRTIDIYRRETGNPNYTPTLGQLEASQDASVRMLEGEDRNASRTALDTAQTAAQGRRDAAKRTAEEMRNVTLYRAAFSASLDASIAIMAARGEAFGAASAKIGGESYIDNITPAQRDLQFEALKIGAHRNYVINSTRMRGETESMRLAMGGSPLAANRTNIMADRDAALYALDKSDHDYGARSTNIRQRADQQIEQAERDETRRVMAFETAHSVAGNIFSRRPLFARLDQIEGDRRAALVGITNRDEINRINQRASDQALEAQQSRADDTQNININQQTRDAQLKALIGRNPELATIKDIVGAARAEEARLRQSGFDAQADQARQLGIEALQLQRQNYRESFGAVEIGQNRAMLMGMLPDSVAKRYAEKDPSEVLKQFGDAMSGLGQAGGVADIPQLLKEIKEATQAGWDKIQSFLTH